MHACHLRVHIHVHVHASNQTWPPVFMRRRDWVSCRSDRLARLLWKSRSTGVSGASEPLDKIAPMESSFRTTRWRYVHVVHAVVILPLQQFSQHALCSSPASPLQCTAGR